MTTNEPSKRQSHISGYDIEVPPPKKRASIAPEFEPELVEESPERRKEASILPDLD